MPRAPAQPKSQAAALLPLTELRAATSRGSHKYHRGCNISWMPPSYTTTTSPSSICFGMYIADYPAELARLLSDECHRQLPRNLLRTDDDPKPTRPPVDLSRTTNAALALKAGMWHPADALEWLFDWFLRVARGDWELPRQPGGVSFSRFHEVYLVNWLKLLDVAVLVGAHGWFLGVLMGKIEKWEVVMAGGREAAKKMKETVQGLDEFARADLVETVAVSLACGWLGRVPKVFGVDAKLGDEIAAAVGRQEAASVMKRAVRGRKLAAVLVSSLDGEDGTGDCSSSTLRGDHESSQTGLLSSDGETETDVLVEDTQRKQDW